MQVQVTIAWHQFRKKKSFLLKSAVPASAVLGQQLFKLMKDRVLYVTIVT